MSAPGRMHTTFLQSGFTLIELMVTITVAAVLLALAAPSFADFIDRYRLRGAVDDVVSVLANARTESVKRDANVLIKFDGTSAEWCVGANAALPPTSGAKGGTASDCNCASSSAECTVEPDAPSPKPRLTTDETRHKGVRAAFNTATTFTFNSKLGTVLGSSGAVDDPSGITFTSPRGKYDITVDVNALGQSTVCTPSTKPSIVGIDVCP